MPSSAPCPKQFRCLSIPEGNNPNQVYLHVGPSGDCWTGSSIFAAKHLQPDYVKSVPLSPPHDNLSIDYLLGILEEDEKLAQEIYDTETIPQRLLEKVKTAPPQVNSKRDSE